MNEAIERDELAHIVARHNARERAKQQTVDVLSIAIIFGCALILIALALRGA